MIYDRRGLELKLTVTMNRFAIITETKKKKTFNCFLALRKLTSTTDKIIFSIKNLIDKSNRKEDIYFEINGELRGFNNDTFQFEPRFRRVSESDISRKTTNIRQQQQQQQ